MKILKRAKDGGKDSTVTAYVLIECKSLFSVALLRFDKGSRDNYHSHAFNAVTVFLAGWAVEWLLDRDECGNEVHTPKQYRRFIPKLTLRRTLHKVFAYRTSWAVTFRGPWKDTWEEVTEQGEVITLTHGRKIVNVR